MIKKIAIIGAFGKGRNLYNGQSIKTRIIAEELNRKFGENAIWEIDAFGLFNNFLVIPRLLFALFGYKNVLMMPAHHALLIEAPWLAFWNLFFNRKLHYVVIGGWLPEFIKKHKVVGFSLKYFDGIYVETNNMKMALKKMGLSNVFVMPNCKRLEINKSGFNSINTDTFEFVTFSRVIKEKGINDAIDAIMFANEQTEGCPFRLRIYGQTDPNQRDWFDELCYKYNLLDSSSFVRYCGVVQPDNSTIAFKNVYGLLFPTYYEGEGLAGTLIDSFAAGVPVIASDWRYNTEVVKDHINGLVVPVHDINALVDAIMWSYKHIDEWILLRNNCLNEAQKYLPQNVLHILVQNLK